MCSKTKNNIATTESIINQQTNILQKNSGAKGFGKKVR